MTLTPDFGNSTLAQLYVAGAQPVAPPPAPILPGGFLLSDITQPRDNLGQVDRYAGVTIRNRRVVDISDDITKMTLSQSTTEQSQLTIEIEDRDFSLLRSGLFTGQPLLNYQGLRLELAGVATINRNRGALRLAARSAKVQALKRRRGPLTIFGNEHTFIGRECYAVGLPFVTAPDVTEITGITAGMRVSRDWQPYTSTVQSTEEIPSSWTTFKRLAQQKGWLLFEAGNVLYFAPPSWLFAHSDIVRVRWAGTPEQVRAAPPKPDGAAYGVVLDDNGAQYWKSITASGDYDPGVVDVIEIPEFDHSSDRTETTLSFKVGSGHEGVFVPGKAVDVQGVPYFSGLYLIQTVNYDLDGTDISVTAQTPIDPQPEAGSTLTGFSGRGSTLIGQGLDLSGSTSDKHGLPVCGITIPRFLQGLATVESGNRNLKPNFPGGPSGYYQYIDSTWRAHAGGARVRAYPRACDAPKAVQDAVATEDVQTALRAYGNDWGKVAVAHMYPVGAGNPAVWKYEPYAEPEHPPRPPGWHPGMNPTMIAYARKVLLAAGGVSCGQYDTSNAASRSTGDAPAFVARAVSQIGKPYEQTVSINYLKTANPSVFDCSSLVQWAAYHAAAIRLPRNSGDQWLFCKGSAISVAEALKIRGALLWIDGSGRAGGEHIAISMGDGRDMAAHSVALGLSILPTRASSWSRAALMPGLFYPGISPGGGNFYKQQALPD